MRRLDELSEAQRDIYNWLAEGLTPQDIERRHKVPIGIVNAQITRIKNKGIALPTDKTEPTEPSYTKASSAEPTGFAPQFDPSIYVGTTDKAGPGPTSVGEVLNQVKGKGITDAEMEEVAKKFGTTVARDVHPMALLGVTIQYVKLCGGRFTAHQVIEDVYTALRTMCGDESTNSGATKPLPQTDAERIQLLEEQNAELRKRLGVS